MTLEHILPPNLFEVLDRAGISTARQVMILSVWDIKKCTYLCIDDILFIKNMITDDLSPNSVKGSEMKKDSKILRISSGCIDIDNSLKGGLRRGTITEVFGESGCGKTQLALQFALHNWDVGCFYICTEDLFPTKRFEELKANLPSFTADIDYGKNIFVEHITEAKDLLSCVRVRLQKLLTQKKISLIVIDSVAAPFRCESTNYVKRAEDLRDLAIVLTSVAQENNLAILCINQATACFENSCNVLPSLGLAWSNMVTTRLMLKKTLEIADANTSNQLANCKHDIYIRELNVIFAPDLPYSAIKCIITSSGIQSINS